MKLGGEYQFPGKDSDSADYGRDIFLARIEDLEPRVLETLRDEVYRADESNREEAIASWADRWHLLDGWIIRAARNTLDAWREHFAGADGFPLFWDQQGAEGGHWYPFSDSERRFTPELPAWDPIHETWEYGEREIRRAFERQLIEYRQRIAALAQSRGLERTTEKRNLSHFDILVRWQVQGWTKSRIARAYQLDPTRKRDGELREKLTGTSGVDDALVRTAELIGLTLRRGARGRPRKPPT